MKKKKTNQRKKKIKNGSQPQMKHKNEMKKLKKLNRKHKWRFKAKIVTKNSKLKIKKKKNY